MKNLNVVVKWASVLRYGGQKVLPSYLRLGCTSSIGTTKTRLSPQNNAEYSLHCIGTRNTLIDVKLQYLHIESRRWDLNP